ncbi:hypothetical protein Rcae01_05986 [Novipirellula caenicola]|uniref:Uncharacterized protein n=1 Tax=Novipirellula caenicola TaxID=1536901 RepID=A0ABP9VZF8_9BACT
MTKRKRATCMSPAFFDLVQRFVAMEMFCDFTVGYLTSGYFTTKFTSRPGTTICLTIVLPANCSLTLASAKAISIN